MAMIGLSVTGTIWCIWTATSPALSRRSRAILTRSPIGTSGSDIQSIMADAAASAVITMRSAARLRTCGRLPPYSEQTTDPSSATLLQRPPLAVVPLHRTMVGGSCAQRASECDRLLPAMIKRSAVPAREPLAQACHHSGRVVSCLGRSSVDLLG
jgi:hypothetical protein